jgi:hypothetical protein
MKDSDRKEAEISGADRTKPFYLEASHGHPWWWKIEPWVASPILFAAVIYWAAPYVLRHVFGLSEFDAKNAAGLVALLGMLVSCVVALRIERRNRKKRSRAPK